MRRDQFQLSALGSGYFSAAATELLLQWIRCCNGAAPHELRRSYSVRRVSRTRRAEL